MSLRLANADSDCRGAALAPVRLACLPLASPDENDAMVNTIQRLAAVIIKSAAGGIRLGLTPAMWKSRPSSRRRSESPSSRSNISGAELLIEHLLISEHFGDPIVDFCDLLGRPPARPRASGLSISTTGAVAGRGFGSRWRVAATSPLRHGRHTKAGATDAERFCFDHDHLTALEPRHAASFDPFVARWRGGRIGA